MKQRIILSGLFALLYAHDAHAVTLNAILNNLGDDYAVTISGKVSKPIKGWWASDIDEGLTLEPDGQTVQIVYGGVQYNIIINREFALSSCDGISISAAPSGGKGNNGEPKTICIPNATVQSGFGQKTDYYQRILLALDAKTQEQKDDLPFSFAISSWTSTKYPWFDKTNKSAQTISFTNDDPTVTFTPPLNVMEGYSAWGGGILPRKNHGFIGHIYNASDCALVFFREVEAEAATPELSLSNFNFKKIVLPTSAVPLAGVWIPKNNSDQISLRDNQILIYAISIGRKPKSRQYTIMSEVGGQETGPVQRDVDDIIADREKSYPNQVTQITGQPDIRDSFSETTRYKSNFFYGIATNAQGNVIVATYKKGSGGQPISTKEIGKAVLQGGLSNYFKLVIRSNTTNPDKQGPLVIELSPLKDRKKLFN